jgi:hypothetical protein
VIRRLLQYFGLLPAPDTPFEQPTVAPDPAPTHPPEPRAEGFGRALRTGLVYFGLADDDGPIPGRSRYGDVATALDDEIDALKARVAELERQITRDQREST